MMTGASRPRQLLLVMLVVVVAPIDCALLDRTFLLCPEQGENGFNGAHRLPYCRVLRLRGGRMKNAAAGIKPRKQITSHRPIVKGVSKKVGTKPKKAENMRGSKMFKAQQKKRGDREAQDTDLSPRIVALIPLSQSASTDAAVDCLIETCINRNREGERDGATDNFGAPGLRRTSVTLRLPASCGGPSGRRVTLLQVDTSNPAAMLDALKVADCALLVHHGAELPSPSCTISSPAQMLPFPEKRAGLAIACLRAQGLPSLVAAAATHTKTLDAKTQHAARKMRSKLLDAEGLGSTC